MRSLKVNISIRTFNEAHYFPCLLEAIDTQRSELRNKLILVDSGSTDDTLEIAQSYGCQTLTISKNQLPLGRGLNLSCDAAVGQSLVIINWLCYPCHNNLLQQLVTPLSKEHVSYIYGRQLSKPHISVSELLAKYMLKVSDLHLNLYFHKIPKSSIKKADGSRYEFGNKIFGLKDIYIAKQVVMDEDKKIECVNESEIFNIHQGSWRQVQISFMQKSLALRELNPEIVIRIWCLQYFLKRRIVADRSHPNCSILILKCLIDTIWHKLAQYFGVYQGNQIALAHNSNLRKSCFYPRLLNGIDINSLPFATNQLTSPMDKAPNHRIVELFSMKAHRSRVRGINFPIICGTETMELLSQYGFYEMPKVRIRDHIASICREFARLIFSIKNQINNMEANVCTMSHIRNLIISARTIYNSIAEYVKELLNNKIDSLLTVNRFLTDFVIAIINHIIMTPTRLSAHKI